MVTDYGYGVQTSYMLYLFFIFSLLSYRYLIIINMIKKLELHSFDGFKIELRLTLGQSKLVRPKSIY